MDLTFSQADIDFQMEVRQWIEDNYPQEMRDRKNARRVDLSGRRITCTGSRHCTRRGGRRPVGQLNMVARVLRLRSDTCSILKWRAPERLTLCHLV